MAKYCTKCGKNLVENKPCDCQKEITKKEGKKNIQGFDIGNLLKKLGNITQQMICEPIDTLEKNIKEKYFNVAICSLITFAIVIGLFVYLLIKETIMPFSMLVSFDRMGMFGDYAVIEAPFLNIFMMSSFIAILYIVGLTYITYFVGTKLMRGTSSLKKIFIGYSFSTLILTCGLLLGIVFLWIDISLALLIVLSAMILFMCYQYKSLEYSINLDRNKIGYLLLVTILSTHFILQFLLSKI